MKIVSTTLAGSGAIDVGIRYALRSVRNFVDLCIVIPTSGPPSTKLIEECWEGAGPKVKFCEWSWQGDFSKARNAALDFARAEDADWVITVDDDERVEPHGEDVRAILSESKGTAVLSLDEEETYGKARAIRCSSDVRWIGATHESIVLSAPEELHTFRWLRFSETTPTPEKLREKYERDEKILREETVKDPSSTRTWYYLGASLHGLQRLEEAIEAYRQCARLRGWYEEGAWACYKAAGILVYLQRWDEAIECAGAGMIRDPGMAELPFIAAMAALKKGDFEAAQCWSDLARVHSARSSRAIKRRLGFRDPVALAKASDGCFELWTVAAPEALAEIGEK